MARQARIQNTGNMEEAILAAAEQLFLEKGFALASTTEIARIAGCNQALVHYYFRTKEQLFASIFKSKIAGFAAKFLAIYSMEITFEEKISQIVDVHFDLLSKNPKLLLLIINEITANPDRINPIRESLGELPLKLYDTLSKDLEAEIAAGRVRKMKVTELLFDILSLDMFPFVAAGILKQAWRMTPADYERFIEQRRESVKRTLINTLKP